MKLEQAPGRPITVFCVDDSPGFLGVLRKLIEGTPGFTLIGEADCGEDAIAAVPRLRPDLLLMDVHMPGVGGIQAARILLRRHPELVVVLTSAGELPPASGIATSGQRMGFVRKEDLCRRVLLERWRDGRPCHGPN